LPLAVLIIADESGDDASVTLAAMLPIAGQTLLEYQVRLARACGGGHIVVLVEQLPAAMISLFDRLRDDGIDVDIAREPRDAADRIHPEEQVLLFAPGFVGSQRLVESLIARATPTLVTLPDQPAHNAFERIDAAARWSGLALLSGQSIRQTAAMLGDWSISSTLMRSALQSGAARWQLEQPDGLAIITDAAQAQLVSAKLVRDYGSDDPSLFADLVAHPIARVLVPHLLKWAVPADLVAVMPLILAGSALLLAMLGWFATGFALLCFAALADVIADTLFAVAVRSNASVAFFKRAQPYVFYMLLLLLGWAVSRATGDWAALLLAGWGSSIFMLTSPTAEVIPKWRPTVESSSFLMVLALIFAAPVAGLVGIVCHGLAGQIADRFFRS
jgi:hypothetical protein